MLQAWTQILAPIPLRERRSQAMWVLDDELGAGDTVAWEIDFLMA